MVHGLRGCRLRAIGTRNHRWRCAAGESQPPNPHRRGNVEVYSPSSREFRRPSRRRIRRSRSQTGRRTFRRRDVGCCSRRWWCRLDDSQPHRPGRPCSTSAPLPENDCARVGRPLRSVRVLVVPRRRYLWFPLRAPLCEPSSPAAGSFLFSLFGSNVDGSINLPAPAVGANLIADLVSTGTMNCQLKVRWLRQSVAT